ncbi:MAG: glycosyltransferase family 4 protein [Oscillibacter sp.]|nr:glycosyltransferase family 4 protein [Oscillibacter sp.]
MKILITSDWNDKAVNGVATSVKNLKRGLEERGHEVRVLTLSQNRRSYEENGITYLGSLPVGRIYPGARLRRAFVGKWVRALVEWKPDVVHSQCELSTFFLARNIAEELDIPLVHTYHTVYEDYTHYFSPSVRLGKKAVAALTRWVAEATEAMIVPTDKVRRLLLGYGVCSPIYVVPSGIDLSRFRGKATAEQLREMRERLHIPEGRKILVYVGRLAEEKNLEELLRLRANMDEELTLLIVGGGPWKARLEETAQELGLKAPDVVFAGMVPPEEVCAWYQMGDLFVSASTSETQGLTYAEALASGTPALCRADECLEGVILQGGNGWQYRSEEEFRARVAEFYASPERHQAMRDCARGTAEEYSLEVFAQRAEAIYVERIARHQKRAVSA